ncbi:MAG: UDP-N-acetylglucosamine 1-carboxyvinyltransferase, partial [Candidatus Chisholmbacteria bacterium]|nr:UDP-N-acetylglucosamine 1-carboxyvinyltransferase [Candidatus Chisholmbacteria bacterium]
MADYLIQGGVPLYGCVRLGGAKNASFKLMIGSLLADGESRLLNFSHISDVDITQDIITSLGGQVRSAGERTLFINPQGLKSFTIDKKFGHSSRASSLFVGPLLHRFHKAIFPLPGGDNVGPRPLDRHFAGLTALGATIKQFGDLCQVSAERLTGAEFTFDKPSHTGTETLIMAAVLAQGKTVIDNAALEPEVDDLIFFLNQMGAQIKRSRPRTITITGVSHLKPTIYKIMPDRNEAVSYACAAIATKGDIVVENARSSHLKAFLDKLTATGGGWETGNFGIRFYYRQPLKAVDVITQPHPGFMTDWQPLWAVLMTQAQGESVIHETIHPHRFGYIPGLVNMGARIKLFNPQVTNKAKTYHFNRQDD